MAKDDDATDDFAIAGDGAEPLDTATARMHVEELLLLRRHATTALVDQFHAGQELETAAEKARSTHQSLLKAHVEVVDELRRLHLEAAAQLATEADSPKKGWFSALQGSRSEATTNWLATFGRLWRMAESALRDQNVQRIELTGRDMASIEYEGEPLQRWISIKGGAADGKRIETEYRGLWVSKVDGRLMVIQRGEVRTAHS